jgi:hypothetical protein
MRNSLLSTKILSEDKLNIYRRSVYKKAYMRMSESTNFELLLNKTKTYEEFADHIQDKCWNVDYNLDKLLTPK